MIKRINETVAILAVMLATFSATVAAQSIYGLNFIGEHNLGGAARYAALGYSGIALPDTNHALTMNPASLAGLSSMTFSIYESMSLSRIGTEEVSSDQTRFQLPSVIVAVPLTRGLVASLGYKTRFFGKAEFEFDREVDFSPAPHELYKLNSSLYSAPLSLAWKPVEWLSVAGAFQIENGSIKDEVYVYFDNQEYRSSSSIRTRGFSGNSWALSALARVHRRLWLGVVFDDEIEYTVDETFEYSDGGTDSISTYDFTLPAAWSVGLAAGLTDRWWLTSSFWMRKAPKPDGFEHLEGSLRDETVISVGVERKARKEGSLFSRMPIRVGYYENRIHLEFPAGEPVVSRFFTLGSGFPMPGGPGGIDFSMEFGRIGSVSANGIDEKVVRFGLSMSLSEKWTKRKVERH